VIVLADHPSDLAAGVPSSFATPSLFCWPGRFLSVYWRFRRQESIHAIFSLFSTLEAAAFRTRMVLEGRTTFLRPEVMHLLLPNAHSASLQPETLVTPRSTPAGFCRQAYYLISRTIAQAWSWRWLLHYCKSYLLPWLFTGCLLGLVHRNRLAALESQDECSHLPDSLCAQPLQDLIKRHGLEYVIAISVVSLATFSAGHKHLEQFLREMVSSPRYRPGSFFAARLLAQLGLHILPLSLAMTLCYCFASGHHDGLSGLPIACWLLSSSIVTIIWGLDMSAQTMSKRLQRVFSITVVGLSLLFSNPNGTLASIIGNSQLETLLSIPDSLSYARLSVELFKITISRQYNTSAQHDSIEHVGHAAWLWQALLLTVGVALAIARQRIVILSECWYHPSKKTQLACMCPSQRKKSN